MVYRPGVLEALHRHGGAAGGGGKRLAARCKWHFGGGPRYCQACKEADLPCARGEASPLNGEFCPYIANEAQTLEGFEIWDVIQRGSGQLRLHPSGQILGFDLSALVSIAEALGYDAQALLLLFHYAERGILQAVKHHGDSDHEASISPPGGD
jgi:hypothetical protein